MSFLMDLEDIYQPLVDFIDENFNYIFFLHGDVDQENNTTMFYLPDVVRGDKDNHRLYLEFELPNNLIDKIIEKQQKLMDICRSFEE